MSTRSTVVSFGSFKEGVHLYQECMDEAGDLWLEVTRRDLVFRAAPGQILFTLPAADFDKLVDAYVAERAQRRLAEEKHKAAIFICSMEGHIPGPPDFLYRKVCARCCEILSDDSP
jgi:hypothetical protein